MRFKKGSKVEVLNKKELPSGSWRGAEIIWGNGHNYSIRYENSSSLMSEGMVDRVSRKAIRPCPPLVQGMESWVAGDVVEVFNDFHWKMGAVLKVMGGDHYLVRLLGSCEKFMVHKSNIRLRQSWEDNKWFVIGKGSRSCKNVKFQEALADTKKKVVSTDDCLAVWRNAGFEESNIVPSRTRKRPSPYSSSRLEVYAAKCLKARMTEMSRNQLGKVDAVFYPRENLGDEYMHDSFNNQTTGYSEMESDGEIFESNDSDIASSVGSCDITINSPNKLSTCFPMCPSQDMDSLCSDGESSYFWDDDKEKSSLPLEEEQDARTHRLELHSYRCALEGLYASGPLSWEEEDLLTNLRISLHISNDEHLMELRNLISAGKKSS